ncbi:uncharacterized protein EDB91DRAFT_1046519, partial [Suillus paluster]|uniref:uncharacterized protein n=1 Tax=Suillus paluster TaxID=48578 RepID=UPI001B87D82C
HFFTQIPQPMHKNSEMNDILSVDLTSMQSLPRGPLARALRRCFGWRRTHFDHRT